MTSIAISLHRSREGQNFHIDRKKVVLADPIKQVGEYKVAVKLHKDVSVDVPVNVVAEATE